jgi:hypothetical protein
VLLPEARIPVVNQVSTRVHSDIGISAVAGSARPSGPPAMKPRTAHCACKDPEMYDQRPESRQPPSTRSPRPIGEPEPQIRALGVAPNTSSWAFPEYRLVIHAHTPDSETTQPAPPSPSATADETSSNVRMLPSWPP